MKRFFPIMNDDTEKGMHFALLAYWVFAFGVMPSWMPLLGDGYWDNLPVISWFEITYHIINGVVIFIMLRTYFKDSFLNVQLDPKGFLKIVGFSALLMLALAAGLRCWLGRGMTDIYPLKEMSVALTSGLLVKLQPIFGTVCLSIFTPIAMVGLFYVSIFAPVCRRNCWLGYVVVTVLMAVPCALDILWRGQAIRTILIFALQMPMHWIACWTYQKADTVWAPIVTLAIFNLGTSLMAFL